MAAIPAAQLGLLHKYATNISRDPTNQKFRRIRLSNAKFEAVWALKEAKQLLAASGWTPDVEDGFLVLPGDADHSVFAMFVDELVGSQPTPTVAAPASAARPQASAPAKPAHPQEQEMSAKEKEFHESRRKALQAAKRAKDEKKRIRAQIEADRDQVSKRKLKDSKAGEKKFGANISRYSDIGVDLNASAGG